MFLFFFCKINTWVVAPVSIVHNLFVGYYVQNICNFLVINKI